MLAPVRVPRCSGYPYVKNIFVFFLSTDMWTEYLALILHDTNFWINPVSCTPRTEKENNELCSCKSIQSFLPRLDTLGWVTCLQKTELWRKLQRSRRRYYTLMPFSAFVGWQWPAPCFPEVFVRYLLLQQPDISHCGWGRSGQMVHPCLLLPKWHNHKPSRNGRSSSICLLIS